MNFTTVDMEHILRSDVLPNIVQSITPILGVLYRNNIEP